MPAALMVLHLVSRGLFIVPFSKDPVLNYFSMGSVTPMRPSMGLHCNTLLWLQLILNRAPHHQKNKNKKKTHYLWTLATAL